MNDKEIALNAAIFAIGKLQDRGSSSYTVKDKERNWHTKNWNNIINILYEMLKGIENE